MIFLKVTPEEIDERASEIRAIITDIDGVWTNGHFGYANTDEIKFFNAHDGQGVVLAKKMGFIVGAISGKGAEANRRRARDLGIDFLHEGVKDKLAVFEEVCATYNLAPAECLYLGDDLPDIPVIIAAGIGIAVKNAMPVLDRFADLKTERVGGNGAVREVIDWLLERQGRAEAAIQLYANPQKNEGD